MVIVGNIYSMVYNQSHTIKLSGDMLQSQQWKNYNQFHVRNDIMYKLVCINML